MTNLDWSQLKTAEQVDAENRVTIEPAVRAEATRRIEKLWSKTGQSNAALGVYGEVETQACINWINSHREACQAILGRPDLMQLNIADNSLWPVAPNK